MSYGRTNLNQRLNKPLTVFRKSSALNISASGIVYGVDITPDGKTLAFTWPSGTSTSRICVMRGSGWPYVYSAQQFMSGHATTAVAEPYISSNSGYVVELYPGIMTAGQVYTGYFSGETLNMFSAPVAVAAPTSSISAAISSNGQYMLATTATTGSVYKLSGNAWTSLTGSGITSFGAVRFFGANDDLLSVNAAKTTIYKRSGDMFTEQTSRDHGVTATPRSAGISVGGKLCVSAVSASPYLIFSEYDGSTLRESNITTDFDIPFLTRCALSSDGNYLAVVYNAAPYLIIAQRQGSVFKKLPDPDVMPTAAVRGCAFTENGERLLVGGDNFLAMYER